MDVQKIRKWNIVERHKQTLYLKAKPEERPPSVSMWSNPPLILPKPACGGETKRHFNEGRGMELRIHGR